MQISESFTHITGVMEAKAMRAFSIDRISLNCLTQVFAICCIRYMFTLGGLNLPEPEKLPGTNLKSPFYFIGDGAFPLNTSIMNSYGKLILTKNIELLIIGSKVKIY